MNGATPFAHVRERGCGWLGGRVGRIAPEMVVQK